MPYSSPEVEQRFNNMFGNFQKMMPPPAAMPTQQNRPPLNSFFQNSQQQVAPGTRPPLESFFKNPPAATTPTPQAPPPPANQGNGFMNFLNGVGNVGKGIANFGVQAVGEAVKTVPNLIQGGADFISSSPVSQLIEKKRREDPNFKPLFEAPSLGDAIRPLTQGANDIITAGQNAAADAYGQPREGLFNTTGLGRLTGQIGSAIWGANKFQKALGAKMPVPTSNLGNLAQFGLKSIAGTTGSVESTQGRLPTSNEIGLGMGIDAGIGGLASALKWLGPKAGDALYRFGTKIKGSDFEKTSELVERAQNLGLRGPREQLASKAQQIIESSGQELKNMLNKSKLSYSVDDLTNSAVEASTQAAKIGDEGMSAQMDKIIASFRKARGGKLTPADLLDIKRYAAEKILPNLKRGEVAGGLTINQTAQKNFWTEVWKNSKSLLDNIDPRVKELNQNIEAAYAIKTPTDKLLNAVPEITSWENTIGKLLRAPTLTTNAAAGLRQAKFLNPLLISGGVKSIPLLAGAKSQDQQQQPEMLPPPPPSQNPFQQPNMFQQQPFGMPQQNMFQPQASPDPMGRPPIESFFR